FIGGKIDGIVKLRAASAHALAALARLLRRVAAAVVIVGIVVRIGMRGLKGVQRVFQLGARRGHILQKLHFMIEVDEEGDVLFLFQHLVEKFVAGGALVVQHIALAKTGVHEQAEGERQVALLRKIMDGLWGAVIGEDEIVFGEILDQRAVFIAHGGKCIDDIYFYGDIGWLVGRGGIGRCGGSLRGRRARVTWHSLGYGR